MDPKTIISMTLSVLTIVLGVIIVLMLKAIGDDAKIINKLTQILDNKKKEKAKLEQHLAEILKKIE